MIMPDDVKQKRDEFNSLAEAARSNAVDFMKRANEMVVGMQGGSVPNTPENRDIIRTYCIIAEANVNIANQLREHVQFIDTSHIVSPVGPPTNFAFPTDDEEEEDGQQ